MTKPTCTLYGGRIVKCACCCFFCFFSFITKRKKKSTANSYDLISNRFLAKIKGNQILNEAKFKLIWRRKNKLTNGHGGMIIQLRAAVFKRIRNVQMQALRSVFVCLLSLPFKCVFHLRFKRNRRHVVYNDVTRDSVTCSLTLCHVTENRYVKCSVHFVGWNIFHLLSCEQNLLTNRIAGKLMNIKKIKLLNYNLSVLRVSIEDFI